MKKISLVFLIFAYFFSFYIAYIQTDYDEFEKIKNIEKTIGKEFLIPNYPGLTDQEELYPILCEAASDVKVNIIRTGINYKENDEVEVLKYIFLTTKTNFFDNFSLKRGRFPDAGDNIQDNFYLSTRSSEGKNQIGEIKDFADNNLIVIKSLKEVYDYYPAYGTYYIETSDSKEFSEFVHTFVDKANDYYAKYNFSYTAEDFLKGTETSEINEVSFSWLRLLKYESYIIYIIAVILLTYSILNESRRIGIIKMHGVSNARLWFIVVGKLITYAFIFSMALSAFLFLFIKNITIAFINNYFLYQLKAYVILMGISIAPYIYILRIRVSSVVKNYRDTKGIFALNMMLKVVCSVLIITMGISIWSQYNDIKTKSDDLKNWENIKDYGVFDGVYCGYDGDEIFGEESQFELISHNELYFLLNKMEAVLVNSRSYEEMHLFLNRDWDGIRSITVNGNYLREFPVLDIVGNAVQIPESTSDWVLLVPEKYRNKQAEIISFFEESRKGRIEIDQSFYDQIVSDSIINQQIKIIWTKNEQKIFSFNPKVFPSENNIIVDPIIGVVTEKNSLFADRDSILGGGGTDPLKIKLINRNSKETYEALKPDLKMLGVDDNLKHLITIDQFILEEIYYNQNEIRHNLIITLGLLCGLLLLTVQNLIIFFNKNQQRFIVRRLFGIGFFRTYKEYFKLYSSIWVIQIIASCIIYRRVEDRLFIVAAILMLIEMGASAGVLMIIEKKNRLKVLKGGI